MIVLESTRVLGLVYWATGPAYPTWTAPLEAASPHSKILEILFFTTNHTKLTTTKTPPPTPPQQQQKSKSHRNQNRIEKEIGSWVFGEVEGFESPTKSKARGLKALGRRSVGRKLWLWVEGSGFVGDLGSGFVGEVEDWFVGLWHEGSRLPAKLKARGRRRWAFSSSSLSLSLSLSLSVFRKMRF